MKISRASTGSIRAYGTLRPATIGTPNRVTRSVAITAAWRADQRGSEYVRLSRCPPTSSTQAALIGATVRAHSRVVSTISTAITNGGWVLASDEPGLIANRVPRAPRYSRGGRGGAGPPLAAGRLLRCRPGRRGTAARSGRRCAPARSGRPPVARQLQVTADVAQLGVQVLPLADPQEVQVLLPAHPPEGVAGQGSLRAAQVVPQPQVRLEVASVGVGRDGLGLGRAVARLASTAASSTPAIGAQNRRCSASALSRSSAGRSRGSWIDRPATMITISGRQPSVSAASSIRPIRGSTGSWASFRPMPVSLGRSPGPTRAPRARSAAAARR